MSQNVAPEKGQISIHTENIFPIIKKWLYSEKEIFLRELISNAVDAIHKLQNINLMEGLQISDHFQVRINIDKEAGTLTVSDNGIGMTADEVRKYINQVAFSSAEDFVERFKGMENKNEIIGHFGLGFYSSFMVADQVQIRTRSYQEGTPAAQWTCDGSTSYELVESERQGRGTDIILHLGDEAAEFLEEAKVREIVTRYCRFMPVEIALKDEVINDTAPLWTRSASELSDEDYKAFHAKLYPMAEEPLFWIHLNIDFPFHLKGVLYFPKLTTEFDATKCNIKLFCNQVFVSDNCPELLPEFLLPLQGCLDAPDLPLNVSRSYLQNEPQVRKIREVISSRIAGKIVELSKKDREGYTKIWEDIHTFIKFGAMQEDKFYDKVKDHLIFRSSNNEEFTTLPEYLERAKASHENKVYYANDEATQAPYLRLFATQGIEVLVLDALIDTHFTQFLEMKNSDMKFLRVDSDLAEGMINDDAAKKIVEGSDEKTREDEIREALEAQLDTKGLSVRVENLKDETVSGIILLSEQTRRMKDMTRMMGRGATDLFDDHTLLVNSNSPVVKSLLRMQEGGRQEEAALLAHQIYDLAMLSQKSFDKDRMEAFLARSNKIMALVNS